MERRESIERRVKYQFSRAYYQDMHISNPLVHINSCSDSDQPLIYVYVSTATYYKYRTSGSLGIEAAEATAHISAYTWWMR